MSTSEDSTLHTTETSTPPTMVNASVQTSSSTESSIMEEEEVRPWTTNNERAIDEVEANGRFEKYVEEINRSERHREVVQEMLEQDFHRAPTHSPSLPPLLIREGGSGIIFPDCETYLTAPVTYLMGLIEGTPSHEFVSGPTQPEITRALEILREERSFVRHAQRSLEVREGTITARITAGEARLIGLTRGEPVTDTTSSPSDYYMPTMALVSRSSSSASNGSPLHPMLGTYRNPTFVYHPFCFGQRTSPARFLQNPIIEYDSSDSEPPRRITF